MNTPRGSMLVISSPSGTGKSTICRFLLDSMIGVVMSVSATTRPRRPGETDGVDYHFFDRDTFISRRDSGKFLEWAMVHGEYYGTPAEQIDKYLNTGLDVIFDVDWQGARALQLVRPGDVVSVFVLPPSMAELRKRLEKRQGATHENTEYRLAGAADDVLRWGEYDYALVNADLNAACNDVAAILTVRRLKRKKATLGPAVDTLLGRKHQP